MDFNDFQIQAHKTAQYPSRLQIIYPAIGISSESGELLEKLKKQLRKAAPLEDPEFQADLKKEMGDVLWYLSELATCLDTPLSEIARLNLEKLKSRADRGVIMGEGDNR